MKSQRRKLDEARHAPNKIFKIRFYDCSSYEEIVRVGEILANCDANIQDFRMNYKTKSNKKETGEWSFRVSTCFDIFVEKLKKTDIWERSDYFEVLTGSVSESYHEPLGFR